MATEYRLIHTDELDQILDLWIEVYPGTNRERWQREFLSIPGSEAHTYVAVEGGRVLSTALLWIREMNDTSGTARRVGNISHVTTHPGARRRGHATRLLERLIEAMRQEGCAYSTLFTSDEGRPLYEKLGWQTCLLPLWQGMLTKRGFPETTRYSVRFARPSDDPNVWDTLSDIYTDFNKNRPLAIRRDTETWKGFIANKITDWMQEGASVWLVHPTDTPEWICGYLIAHGGEHGFLVAEAGVREGHRAALANLLGQVIGSYEAGKSIGGRVYLPNEPEIKALLESCFEPLVQFESNDMMVRAINPDMNLDPSMIPRAHGSEMFWLLDQL